MSTLFLVMLWTLGVDMAWDRPAPWYVVAPLADLAFWCGVLSMVTWPRRRRSELSGEGR